MLDEIYAQYDSKLVEANKRLPKPCYGNSGGYYCNYECEQKYTCGSVTNTKWGECNCKFKTSCHLSRQHLAKDRFERCSFRGYFDEETYPELPTIPEGIIRMNPIED